MQVRVSGVLKNPTKESKRGQGGYQLLGLCNYLEAGPIESKTCKSNCYIWFCKNPKMFIRRYSSALSRFENPAATL